LTVTEDCNISYPIERTNYQKNILIVWLFYIWHVKCCK
jgi:hypothetical protein